MILVNILLSLKKINISNKSVRSGCEVMLDTSLLKSNLYRLETLRLKYLLRLIKVF